MRSPSLPPSNAKLAASKPCARCRSGNASSRNITRSPILSRAANSTQRTKRKCSAVANNIKHPNGKSNFDRQQVRRRAPPGPPQGRRPGRLRGGIKKAEGPASELGDPPEARGRNRPRHRQSSHPSGSREISEGPEPEEFRGAAPNRVHGFYQRPQPSPRGRRPAHRAATPSDPLPNSESVR